MKEADVLLRQRSSQGAQEPETVRVRTISRPWLVAAFLLTNVLIAAAAFTYGQSVRQPEADAVGAVGETIAVYAAVERRQVTKGVTARGTVKQGPVVRINGSKVGGESLPVVTQVLMKPGETVVNGSLLATVADRPLFLLDLEIPLYRNLHLKDKGTDVFSLQRALGAPETGIFDSATLWWWRQLYLRHDVRPPGGLGDETFVSMAEVQSLPAGDVPPTILNVASPGTLLAEEDDLAVLLVGPAHVEFRASLREASGLSTGSDVSISNQNGDTSMAKVAELGPFEAATAGEQPQKAGQLVRIALDDTSQQKFPQGINVSVSTHGTSGPVLALPSLAVREDGGRKFVVVRSPDGETRQVDVAILSTESGWTSVREGGLQVGDQVQVSP